ATLLEIHLKKQRWLAGPDYFAARVQVPTQQRLTERRGDDRCRRVIDREDDDARHAIGNAITQETADGAGVERLITAVGEKSRQDVRLPNGCRLRVRAVEEHGALDRRARSGAQRVYAAVGAADDDQIPGNDGRREDCRAGAKHPLLRTARAIDGVHTARRVAEVHEITGDSRRRPHRYI